MSSPGSAPTVAESGLPSELSELRELILGPEWERLREVRERIQNRTLRAADVAEVLPEALFVRARRDAQLRQALQPVLEDAILASVRKNPKVLAEALFPMISRAIRRALATALQGMVESLNQIVETSFTWRSVRWRIEALRTGKPYGEIALLRSLLYKVEQVFLIHRQTGLLMQHAVADAAMVRDPDMVSAMLTAIQDFVRDSFGDGDEPLETMRVGEVSIWVQHGPQAILAGVVRGTPPPQLRNVFSSALERIQHDFGEHLAAFDGDPALLEPARPVMQTCLIGQSPKRRRASLVPVYVLLGVVVAAAAIAFALWSREQRRWDAYLAAIRNEPGIVITDQNNGWGRYRVSGLRDPLARDPAELLPAAGFDPGTVAFEWEPYLSLSPALAARRELNSLKTAIEQHTIRFDPGQSDLTGGAMDSLETAAAQIQKLFATAERHLRLEVTGHTDERGSEEINTRLGSDRAQQVATALANLGVDAGRLSVRSAGASEPVRRGRTDRDRSFNRSVTIHVLGETQ
jgi:OOP family OmpA-OmpF porin